MGNGGKNGIGEKDHYRTGTEEKQKVLKRLSDGKAVGTDGLPSEVWEKRSGKLGIANV